MGGKESSTLLSPQIVVVLLIVIVPVVVTVLYQVGGMATNVQLLTIAERVTTQL